LDQIPLNPNHSGLVSPRSFSFLFVVPTLDSFKLLPRLISSLQDQTWLDWRILFVDGPSSKQHQECLQNFAIHEPRCSWIAQDASDIGIFGAMNQGFKAAMPTDYVIFWGSDDWAASSTILADVAVSLHQYEALDSLPDLLVCNGRYVKALSGRMDRLTSFSSAGFFLTKDYRRALFLGSTPPHQATLFGNGARKRLNLYNSSYRLSADLDYFLRLSKYKDLRIQCLDLEFVHMSDGGVSGQQTQRRISEVQKAYRFSFGCLWWIPFGLRYLRRLISILEFNR
jgi:glycosyltransferase involved in cell wall biosynthesis